MNGSLEKISVIICNIIGNVLIIIGLALIAWKGLYSLFSQDFINMIRSGILELIVACLLVIAGATMVILGTIIDRWN